MIIDCGSGYCKVGFAGEARPRSIFRSIVGRHKYKQLNVRHKEEVFVGDDARGKAEILDLRYPIERGVINSWDDLEKIWHHSFYEELRVDPTEHAVLTTEPVLNSKKCREKIISLMFDRFNVPSFYLGNQAVLSLFSSYRTTGIVLESGDGISQIVPVYEGGYLPDALFKLDFAGQDLTARLAHLLKNKGLHFGSFSEQEILLDIKKRLCYIANDYDVELQNSYLNRKVDRSFRLPDGTSISLDIDRFMCPEVLFRPGLANLDFKGIHKVLHESIERCGFDLSKDLYENIVLTGGNTMFDGFATRLTKEMITLAPKAVKVKICADEDRSFGTFVGGSILSALDTFPGLVISLAEYQENGPGIVHQKCP